MLITQEREKLLNTIVFFSKNVNFFGKIKLFKLLYFFDFEHFKFTGRNVTGLDYYAWEMGPVPVTLFEELENPKADLIEKISIELKETRHKYPMLTMNVKKDIFFNPSIFTKRELQILKNLVEEYKDTKAEKMIENTHLENHPWDKIYNQLNLKKQLIPYELALRSQEKERINHLINERDEFLKTLQ